MIKFFYSQKIEDLVFKDYILPKKSSVVSQMIKEEISEVLLPRGNKFINDQIKFISKKWSETENKFLTELGKFYSKKLESPKLKCYLTRLDTFPYNYKSDNREHWFTAPLFRNPIERNRVIMHELCHYFQPTDLPRPIKEAIPVILNDHERFGMYGEERGNQEPEEQKWRKIIWDIYKSGGNFNTLLEHTKQQNLG
jgi:hypothetical protein